MFRIYSVLVCGPRRWKLYLVRVKKGYAQEAPLLNMMTVEAIPCACLSCSQAPALERWEAVIIFLLIYQDILLSSFL